MKRFWPYLRYLKPVRWHFAAGIFAGLLYSVASGLGLPLVTKVVVPLLFGEDADGEQSQWYVDTLESFLGALDPNAILMLSCIWIPLMFLVRGLGGYLNSYLINYCGFRVLESLRAETFAKLQSLPVSFFQKHRSGDLLARLLGDTEILRQVISQTSSDLIKQPATLVAALTFLIVEAVNEEGMFVVLIALGSVPLCVLPIRLAGRKLKKRAEALQRETGGVSAMLAENLQSPIEVRAYNLQERESSRFGRMIGELLRLSAKIVKYREAISPSIEVVAAVGFAIALYLGVKNGMSQASFVAAGMALYMAYEPVKKLGRIHAMFRQGEGALNRIEEILEAEDHLPETTDPHHADGTRGEIRFDEVRFSYAQEEVLRGITVEIPPGQCVALVGPSGGGKSTFANLIPRLFDVDSGSVSLDGVDVRRWNKADLRNRIAVVPQMPILFSGTIYENILLGKLEAGKDEVEEAARRAHAHEFILELPDGYDTEVSEKGTRLSGGQRQRIALARAFLKDAPVLILDEATSALDSVSEAHIQEALAELIKGRTTIIIAHRLSTTRIADRVLEFDRGKIVSNNTQEAAR
ncbi:MAG: ABC transporter ATP-binding protein [Akkermansiaceae bacterium]|nr:ABC transporter ATP-binding protein [Akkermansiaceae bacterium]